ncbi:MAG: hypothetical protein QOH78_510, partial [Verrucomicrobiota bacterium]
GPRIGFFGLSFGRRSKKIEMQVTSLQTIVLLKIRAPGHDPDFSFCNSCNFSKTAILHVIFSLKPSPPLVRWVLLASGHS